MQFIYICKIRKNMSKYAKICQNMQKYAKICKNIAFEHINAKIYKYVKYA